MNELKKRYKIPLARGFSFYYISAIALLLSITACEQNPDYEVEPEQPIQASSTQYSIYGNDADTVETATTLAYKLPNPYTVPNMRQAYQNVYGSSGSHIVATHQYVRFRPANTDQLLVLIENLDLDLFDVPLDYKITQEGDYYQDPTIPDGEITWQYTVVPVNFSFPTGVPYELLSYIHIPSDSHDLMEAEAEKLVGLNADGDDFAFSSFPTSTATTDGSSLNNGPTCPGCDTPICAPGFLWDTVSGSCAPDTRCPPGYIWDDSMGGCISTNPPRPPQGQILVRDTELPHNSRDEGVQKVRVVAKRWFKIERMYTNNSGYFQSNKKFRNSVKLAIKFKNNDATIRGMRGVRVWEILLPVKKVLGPMKGSQINNFTYTFERNDIYNSKGTRYWVAATTHNAVQQFKTYSVQEGTGPLPSSSLKILLTNWAELSGKGSAPLFSVRWINDLNANFLTAFVFSGVHPIAGYMSDFTSIMKRQIDITYSYNVAPGRLTSNRVVTTMYHELAHATLYKKAGANWYEAVVDGTIEEMIASGFGDYSPYGDGTTANSGIIAVNEAWGNHFGYYLANKRYGSVINCVSPQDNAYEVCSLNGFISYAAALEAFDPNYIDDLHSWIPVGILWDLHDPSNEVRPPNAVHDQVSGFTNSQLFQAMASDVRSPQAYRNRLLQLNGNAQSTQINFLFAEYGYR